MPVLLYDNRTPDDSDWQDSVLISWLPSALRNNQRVKDYTYRARNLLRHVSYQARGHPSGIHGLLHQYVKLPSIGMPLIYCPQIPHRRSHDFCRSSDWSTWFPRNRKVNRSTLPPGSRSVSLRIVESTLRTCNNLLERLHASFFFYLLPDPGSFSKIGNYLPSAVIISTVMLFTGLRSWVQAGWVEVPIPGGKSGQTMKWEHRSRPSLQAVLIILATHTWGAPLYFISSWSTLPRLVRVSSVPSIQPLTQPLSSGLSACRFQCCRFHGSSTRSTRIRETPPRSGCS